MKQKPHRKATSGIRGRPRKTSKASLAPIGSFLVRHPSAPEAIQRAEVQAYRNFDSETGGEIERLRVEEGHVSADLAASDERMQILLIGRKKLNKFERVAPSGQTAFGEWSINDRLLTTAALALSAIVLCMSVLSVRAALINSGLPIFVESPMTSLLLAAGPPSAAFVLHCIPDFLHSERTRDVFDRLLLGGTVLMFSCWTVCFAYQFPGVGATPELDLDGNGFSGSLFMWVQISSETLLGGCLIRIVDRIRSVYAPFRYRRTHAFEENERAIVQEKELSNELRAQSVALAGRRREIEAAREAVANFAVAELVDRRMSLEAYRSDGH